MLYNVFPENFQPKVLATWEEQNATSKTICARNLSYSMERDDMYVLFFVLVVIGYFLYCFSNFKIVQGNSFPRLWRNYRYSSTNRS